MATRRACLRTTKGSASRPLRLAAHTRRMYRAATHAPVAPISLEAAAVVSSPPGTAAAPDGNAEGSGEGSGEGRGASGSHGDGSPRCSASHAALTSDCRTARRARSW